MTEKRKTSKAGGRKLKVKKETIRDLDAKGGKKVRGGIIAVLIGGPDGGVVSRLCTRSECR